MIWTQLSKTKAQIRDLEQHIFHKEKERENLAQFAANLQTEAQSTSTVKQKLEEKIQILFMEKDREREAARESLLAAKEEAHNDAKSKIADLQVYFKIARDKYVCVRVCVRV
jgi:chromosome segregation ATPase